MVSGCGGEQKDNAKKRTEERSTAPQTTVAGETSTTTIHAMVAFVSNRDGDTDIYSMKSDGSNQRKLTDNAAEDLEPNWSPDGNRIVFVSDLNQTGKLDIYSMKADGTDQNRLTDDKALDVEPAFSPDANKIVFTSTRDGDQEIFSMNTDGSGQRRLTNNTDYDG